MRNFIKIFLLFLLLTTTVCGQNKKVETPKQKEIKGNAKITVTYIANEGVLISSGDKKVLIDSLHREYEPAYAFPPPDLQNLLENAQKPYDKINLLLVSHIHLDHFHPESVALHLQNNPTAIFASSEQAVSEVAKNFADYEKIKLQIKPVTHEWKKFFELNHDGIKVKFLGLRHGSERFREIQNMGHLIEVGGMKFLHIGDAGMTDENFASFDLAKENIDIAFIPYWFLLSEDGRNLVKEQFAPKKIIAVHIPPDEAEKIAADFKKTNPGVIAFTKILEKVEF